MESDKKQKLFEQAVVERPEDTFFEGTQSVLPFGLPLWMLVLIVLVLALAGVGVIKVQSTSKSDDAGKKKDSK